MIGILAFRHLWVRKLRALFLLLGYGLGVGVMIVLLSVGEAMVDQSRDVALVGGGEVTVLPLGIDVEAMRTGGASGMFFGIDRARFLTRQLLGGPRHAALVASVSPAIENKLIYLRHRGRLLAARAGGEIPSRAASVGAPLQLLSGEWRDQPEDSAYIAPTAQQLYDELDRFHLPSSADSSWGEWQYFNFVTGPAEWWYLTYLVGGRVLQGKWGGQLLVTHRRPDGRYEHFLDVVSSSGITFDTAGADLTLGQSRVRQRAGRYSLTGRAAGTAGGVTLDLEVTPDPNRYFPPVVLSEGAYSSGYVVPALSARASGRICVAQSRCVTLRNAPAYHDHNWGVWRDVTWDWGSAQGMTFNLLYGGLHTPADYSGAPPFFVTLVDSLGLSQILRAPEIRYAGRRRMSEVEGVFAPGRFEFMAQREGDTVRVQVTVDDAHATRMATSGFDRYFLQLRGRFRLDGRLGGRLVADSGSGFFETYAGKAGEQ